MTHIRYEQLQRLYPGFEQALGQLADYIHNGNGTDIALAWMDHWIRDHVDKKHRLAAYKKACDFAFAVTATQ